MPKLWAHNFRVIEKFIKLKVYKFEGKIWNSVAETFIDCTLEWGDRRCRSETVRKAWALIIAFMIERIKIGHVDQVKEIYLQPNFFSENNC